MFVGETRVFACTGVFVGYHEYTTRILTSASLVRTSADANEIDKNLEVCTAHHYLFLVHS
jgi:hypothetical protein